MQVYCRLIVLRSVLQLFFIYKFFYDNNTVIIDRKYYIKKLKNIVLKFLVHSQLVTMASASSTGLSPLFVENINKALEGGDPIIQSMATKLPPVVGKISTLASRIADAAKSGDSLAQTVVWAYAQTVEQLEENMILARL